MPQLKCDGLDAGQLARRAVELSTMSLLGLVRHMAEVERGWFRRRFAGHDVPRRYQTEADPDADFNRAVADPASSRTTEWCSGANYGQHPAFRAGPGRSPCRYRRWHR